MNAQEKDRALAIRIVEMPGHEGKERTRLFAMEDARTLRRAQLTLHRWAEEICNGTIQREGEQGDGKPMRVWEGARIGSLVFVSARHSAPIADREAGALRRVAEVCEATGLHFYHQTDPRGCALYVSTEPLNDQNYNRGVACI